jgi:hypothetical protein
MKDAETRNSYRGIDVLVNGYILEGNQSYLVAAHEMLVNNLLVREGGANVNDGKSGWIQGGVPGTVSIIYDNWQIEPLIKLHIALLAAGNQENADNLRDFFYRWSNWARNTLWSILPHGTYQNGMNLYFPYVLFNVWNFETNTLSGGVDAEHSLGYANLFTYRYYLETSSNRKEWISLAHKIFKDYNYYGFVAEWTNTRTQLQEYPHGVPGFFDDSGPGLWKIPKSIISPMYYIFTESKADY